MERRTEKKYRTKYTHEPKSERVKLREIESECVRVGVNSNVESVQCAPHPLERLGLITGGVVEKKRLVLIKK